MNKTSPEILELRKRIEDDVKRKMKTPADFIFLSGAIWVVSLTAIPLLSLTT